ncbi:hypothetical protein POI8812_03113 [Pontivivens insulae]|uniref:YjiS-like domain-containing protein n=2 Tax=Pontivivens insulae TaxID=1639689 RepID=A0A2R8AFD0_9RHOB|nr:uncharacterized protein DUF1127 [Pontivivens insulae]SPF30770.1 hypothetical protein POI8812_03113 [Pontivivens insulae]
MQIMHGGWAETKIAGDAALPTLHCSKTLYGGLETVPQTEGTEDMAFVTASDIRTENLIAQRVVAFFNDARTAFNKRRMYNRTVSELNALSSNELNDLGLSRAGIRAAAYEAVYG